MNIVKVYDINGNHVDSFRKLQKKRAIYAHTKNGFQINPRFKQLVQHLNRNKFFVRRQLSSISKSLGNVGIFAAKPVSAIIRSVFK